MRTTKTLYGDTDPVVQISLSFSMTSHHKMFTNKHGPPLSSYIPGSFLGPWHQCLQHTFVALSLTSLSPSVFIVTVCLFITVSAIVVALPNMSAAVASHIALRNEDRCWNENCCTLNGSVLQGRHADIASPPPGSSHHL